MSAALERFANTFWKGFSGVPLEQGTTLRQHRALDRSLRAAFEELRDSPPALALDSERQALREIIDGILE